MANISLVIVEIPENRYENAKAQLRGYKHVQDVEDDFYVNWLKMDGPQTFAEVPMPSFGAVMGQLPKFAPRLRDAPSVDASRAVPADPSAPDPSLIQGEVPWGVARVKAPDFWETNNPATMGADVNVAVIDTGIACDHPDLDCKLSEGVNFVDPQAASRPVRRDDQGHGTHVAGTIAARWDGHGVVGVAPLAHVIPVKVLDAKGGGSLSNIVRGINWASRQGVDVINMSLGAPQTSPSLQRAVDNALRNGVTIVAASGNEGPDNGPSYPGVIAVGASDKNDQLASFSSQGDYVSLIAPGVEVISTAPGGKYAKHSGTSMAAPHVSGLAAIAVALGARGPAGVANALGNAAGRLCSARVCLPPAAQGAGLPEATKLGR